MICKKQKPSWHRNSNFSPCGKLLTKRKNNSFKREKLRDYSWFWKDVTCKGCLKLMTEKLVISRRILE